MQGIDILSDDGLGSIFAQEIREKRGLAYYASGIQRQLFQFPILGFTANPLLEKGAEAIEVFSQLIEKGYRTGNLIEDLSKKDFERQWSAFQKQRTLSRVEASARLSEKRMVVTGLQSEEYYRSLPQDWKLNREALIQQMKEFEIGRNWVFSLVGDASKLRPWVEKSFPGVPVRVIPYRQALQTKTYRITP